MGKLRTRKSFSRIDEVLDMPNLIEVQKNSYKRFLTDDLKEVLADVSPITDYSDNLVLEFVDYSLDSTPKNSVERCRERDLTYSAPLKVFVRLKNRETGEIKESDVFMGEFPLMTEHGTFIINGAERVIVSQLVRSPGAYYDCQIDKAGKRLYSAQVIPNRGAWLEYETDSNDVIWVRIDRARKLPVTVLLRALGYGTDVEITDRMCEGVLKAIINEAPKVMADLTNYQARANIMWSGMVAHNDILGVGRVQDWASHDIEHELSAWYDCAHGAGLAVISPAWMKYVYKHNLNRFVQFAVRVWDCEMDFENPERTALAGIAKWEAFLTSIGMPITFAQLGAKEEDIPDMVKHLSLRGGVGGFVRIYDEEAEAIFRLACR